MSRAGFRGPVRGLHRGEDNCYYHYTVYDNATDEIIVADATYKEAAKSLGIKESTFRAYMCHQLAGTRRLKYYFYRYVAGEDEV